MHRKLHSPRRAEGKEPTFNARKDEALNPVTNLKVTKLRRTRDVGRKTRIKGHPKTLSLKAGNVAISKVPEVES